MVDIDFVSLDSPRVVLQALDLGTNYVSMY